MVAAFAKNLFFEIFLASLDSVLSYSPSRVKEFLPHSSSSGKIYEGAKNIF
jgi:hypothetical protein